MPAPGAFAYFMLASMKNVLVWFGYLAFKDRTLCHWLDCSAGFWFLDRLPCLILRFRDRG